MRDIIITIAIFFWTIIYFAFNDGSKYYKEGIGEYTSSYRYEMSKRQQEYMDKITKDMPNPSNKFNLNKTGAVFITYYYDVYTINDIENLKNNARNNGWHDINLINEENIIYASCNENIAFNIYREKQLKIGIYWRRDGNDCPNN